MVSLGPFSTNHKYYLPGPRPSILEDDDADEYARQGPAAVRTVTRTAIIKCKQLTSTTPNFYSKSQRKNISYGLIQQLLVSYC